MGHAQGKENFDYGFGHESGPVGKSEGSLLAMGMAFDCSIWDSGLGAQEWADPSVNPLLRLAMLTEHLVASSPPGKTPSTQCPASSSSSKMPRERESLDVDGSSEGDSKTGSWSHLKGTKDSDCDWAPMGNDYGVAQMDSDSELDQLPPFKKRLVMCRSQERE
jgi:hypothetical protein